MNNVQLNFILTDISQMQENSVWCPTFQLIWNDLKNKVIGQEIVFEEDKKNIFVKDLNQESFKETMISDEYYYKNYGYMTLDFKETIKNDIWNKFREESDILDQFNFSENNRDYFFYSMLVRNFRFPKPFDILSPRTFGIDENSSDELNSNVKVLFYNDYDYAVKLITNNGDEVILYKGERGSSFLETYQRIVNKSQEGVFQSQDTLTVANLNFKSETNYQELQNKNFYDINGISHSIDNVVQTLLFTLDNNGGHIKSEAGMSVKWTSINYGRHFDFSDDFVLFLKEEKQEKPYLGININDIKIFYK